MLQQPSAGVTSPALGILSGMLCGTPMVLARFNCGRHDAVGIAPADSPTMVQLMGIALTLDIILIFFSSSYNCSCMSISSLKFSLEQPLKMGMRNLRQNTLPLSIL